MSSRGRLVAVNHVELEAPPDLADAMTWFYGDLLQLAQIRTNDESTTNVLRFRSDRLELRVTLTDDPKIESVDRRACVEVPSIEDVAAILEDRKYEFSWHRGLQLTDRSLELLDPAGNRVEVRRHWPQRTV
jgi:catechol 2,3-dioxygenase-like lactoylglutathione lyase family enzyme